MLILKKIFIFLIVSFSILPGCALIDMPEPAPSPDIPVAPTATGNFESGFTDGYRTGYYDGSFDAPYANHYPPIDSDGDGMHDNFEVSMGLNPHDPSDAARDLDDDLATNLDEYFAFTSIQKMDTDEDGMPDGFELAYGLNALDASDALIDTDNDGVSNIEEFNTGTDPLDSSSVYIPLPSNVGEPGLNIEYWFGISGLKVTDLTGSPDFPDNPSESAVISEFNIPANTGNNYGVKIKGYIVPPATGDFYFWVSSDDYSELWISGNHNPENLSLIAFVHGWAGSAVYDRYASQASQAVKLEKGKVYYLEGLFKEGAYSDHFSVEWSGPGMDRRLLGAPYLAQWLEPAPLAPGLIAEYWDNIGGLKVSDLTNSSSFQEPPSRVELISEIRIQPNTGNNYGARIRGLLTPPATDNYQFKIASDDYSELWLSTNEDPDKKQLIAQVNGWTQDRQFDKYPEQISLPIPLDLGIHYYVEVLFKEASYSDNLTVEWSSASLPQSTVGGSSVFQWAPSISVLPPLGIEPAPLPVEDSGAVVNSGATGSVGGISSFESTSTSTIIGGGSNSLFVSWVIPSQRVDGTVLELYEIIGYEISIEREGGGITKITINDASISTQTVSGLISGTYRAHIITHAIDDLESEASEIVVKIIP